MSIKKYRSVDSLIDDEVKLNYWCLDIEKKTGRSDVWKIYDNWMLKVYEPQMERLSPCRKFKDND